jgi:hypothetical protein
MGKYEKIRHLKVLVILRQVLMEMMYGMAQV